MNLVCLRAFPQIQEPQNRTLLEPPLVGSNKCTWGPSYWCFSEDNAKECNFDYNECIKYKTIDK